MPAMNSRRRIPHVIAHSLFDQRKCNKHAERPAFAAYSPAAGCRDASKMGLTEPN
jgi:hypothetical protein